MAGGELVRLVIALGLALISAECSVDDEAFRKAMMTEVGE